jgi:molybdenum cofactor cytidylyltransferase
VKFGRVPVAEAEGAILAHSTTVGGKRLRKAHRLGADDIAALKEAGIAEIVVARLAPDDLAEDEAARVLAAALVTENVEAKPPATGRVNLHALTAGVFTVDRALIDAFNAVDPAITIATVDDYDTVEAGAMVATVKIIPFAAPAAKVEAAAGIAAGRRAFGVHAFRPHRVGLVQTELPSLKRSAMDKATELTAARLARSGSSLVAEQRTAHDEQAVAKAIAELAPRSDMLIVFGASAVSDDEDVIPAAIRLAGGEVKRTGAPVDPGNLLVLGALDGKPVIGAPGCARSPKENSFDWVLDRLSAGMSVTSADIGGLGVGGLLMEIPSRPQPREGRAKAATVGAVLLAAGRSSRMGGPNKLLARFGGIPLVRRTAERLCASIAAPVTAVVGHQAGAVREALAGLPLDIVENPDFAIGLAGSLKAGVRHLPASLDGVLVALADMPGVGAADYDRMIAEFRRQGGRVVVRATAGGKRGNPVILPRALLSRIEELEGDTGARHLIETGGLDIVDVELGEAARVDVDTPDALAAAGGVAAE